MADIKISQLPAAAAALGTQEFEVNESGTSKKVTGSQIEAFVKGNLVTSDITDLTATASELNTLDGITASTAELNILDGVTATAAQLNNTQFLPSAGPLSNRNKIINGDMRIDQRNAGAAVTASASGTYFAVDRTLFFKNSSATFSVQQSSAVVPAGFSGSLGISVSTAASSAAAENVVFQHNIEGLNTADLGFGTASAQAVTLSFWVRSSVTGTYCASFRNAAFNRTYVVEYNIAAANTWEFKTITIAGDTAGTWATDTSTGLRVSFDLGSGSDSNATAGAWTASAGTRTTNQVNWANTSGATFYITGVQLEAGDTATPFEHRSYGQELALCQRYYEQVPIVNAGVAAAGQCTTTTGGVLPFVFRVSKRVAATFTTTGTFIALTATGNSAGGTVVATSLGTDATRLDIQSASGLVAGNALVLFANSTGCSLNFSAEL
jgi:hypothetical protein